MSRTTLLVGTAKGAWKLTADERREQWTLSEPMFKGWSVYDLMQDPRTGKQFAAVNSYVYGPNIQISEDQGTTWQQVEHGPAYDEASGFKLNNVWCIVPGRASEPETLYAGVDEAGLFESRDGGLHWEELQGLSRHPTRSEWFPGAGGLCCHSICLDPGNPQRMWVGISAVGVFRTVDGGKTWDVQNNGLQIAIEGQENKTIGSCVHHMVIDPKNPERLFQQNHQGVFRSVNAADSWERIETGLPSIFGFPMVILPHDSNTLYIIPQEKDEFRFAEGGKPAVYRTRDGGEQWEALRAGLPENAYIGVLRQAMAADSYAQPGIYFGTNTGQIYYTRDGGDQWHEMPCLLPRIQSLSIVQED